MNAHLQASLADKIDEWFGDNMDSIKWPQEAYWGEDTVRLMVLAAASVFDAVVEVQEYTLRAEIYEVK